MSSVFLLPARERDVRRGASWRRRGFLPVSLPVTQHNALFPALVSEPARAAVLLAEHLPPEVAALLDPEIPPEAVEGSFGDEATARTQCDELFRARLRSGHDARLYVLLGHKSRVDADTPLHLLKYMVNIRRREIEDGAAGDRLPMIVPLVFYHGRGRWTAARPVSGMIDAPGELEPFVREFAYVVHDLGGRLRPAGCRSRPRYGLGSGAQGCAYRGDSAGSSRPDDGRTGCGSAFERHLVRYIAERMNLTPPLLEASLHRTKPDRREALIGTVAQAWIEQGIEKGIERGRKEGRRQALAELLRQLALRFGDVPDASANGPATRRQPNWRLGRRRCWWPRVSARCWPPRNCRADDEIVRTVCALRREPAMHPNRVASRPRRGDGRRPTRRWRSPHCVGRSQAGLDAATVGGAIMANACLPRRARLSGMLADLDRLRAPETGNDSAACAQNPARR